MVKITSTQQAKRRLLSRTNVRFSERNYYQSYNRHARTISKLLQTIRLSIYLSIYSIYAVLRNSPIRLKLQHAGPGLFTLPARTKLNRL